MIKTTGFNNTLAGLSRTNELTVTQVAFMNKLAKDYGTSIQKDENLGVGQITIASNVFSAIALLNDEEFKPLAYRALKVVLGDKEGFDTGVGEYYGLFVEEVLADGTTMDLVTVSSIQEEMIIAEMISCDLADVKNLRKIFADINDLFRMYQELTIDAAKKLYVIVATFYNEIMKANSTVGLDHNFKSFKDFEGFAIERTSKYVAPKEAKVGEAVEFRNESGEVIKVAFKDMISEVQDVVSEEFSSLINNDILAKYNTIKVSEAIKASFGLGSNFNDFAADMYESIRKPYSKITAWKSQETALAFEKLERKEISKYAYSKRVDEVNKMYDEEIAKLSNLARFLTKNMEMSLAGRLMFMISNIKREKQAWVIDEESTNQLFLTVAPELFAAYIVAEHAELKVCGYKALGETAELVEGQVLTFVNGNAQEVENVYVDSTFTGTLTVETINDVLSVVKPIEVPRVEATVPETIAISIYENSVIDAFNFVRTKEATRTASFETLTNQKVFEKAEKIQLVPFYSYKTNEGKTKHVYNAVVVTVPNLNDPSIKMEIPAAQYICSSAAFEQAIAGLTVSNVVNTRIDGKTMRVLLAYNNFETVELNHSRAEVDAFEGANNDPYSTVVSANKVFGANMSDDPFAQPLATTMTKVSNDNAFGTGSTGSDDSGAFIDEAFIDDNEFSNYDYSALGM